MVRRIGFGDSGGAPGPVRAARTKPAAKPAPTRAAKPAARGPARPARPARRRSHGIKLLIWAIAIFGLIAAALNDAHFLEDFGTRLYDVITGNVDRMNGDLERAVNPEPVTEATPDAARSESDSAGTAPEPAPSAEPDATTPAARPATGRGQNSGSRGD